MVRKTKEQISYNMSRIRSSGTRLETLVTAELERRGITTYIKNDRSVFGTPDFAFRARKVAVFCDSEFWHGYNWDTARATIKSNREFWIAKIEANIKRDAEVTEGLQADGWKVFRFWERQIEKTVSECVDVVEDALRATPLRSPLRTIDLCAGIGGIRRGFELTGLFENVLSAENDAWACKTYEHMYGENPHNDVTSEKFKLLVERTPYEVLLAGFPCQTFSRVGLKEGFDNEEKGQIFYHIAEIIERSRPSAFLLENVYHLVTHDKGETFKFIIERLAAGLRYKIIGVSYDENGDPVYEPTEFIRNSKDFGVPQNRPRTYIIGFDCERFYPDLLDCLPKQLPKQRKHKIYNDLNCLLERDVEAKYYMASGYLETLKRHRKRQEDKGHGFGYRVVNGEGINSPIANTLLAIGGSGKERNLVYDPRDGIGGKLIKGKKTPLNNEGIRVMTPTEWGKLQGFINYAFLDENGSDTFSFHEDIPNAQLYKQFGNAVTIPAIEEMAKFMAGCFVILNREDR